jgi:hypothetical protein
MKSEHAIRSLPTWAGETDTVLFRLAISAAVLWLVAALCYAVYGGNFMQWVWAAASERAYSGCPLEDEAARAACWASNWLAMSWLERFWFGRPYFIVFKLILPAGTLLVAAAYWRPLSRRVAVRFTTYRRWVTEGGVKSPD